MFFQGRQEPHGKTAGFIQALLLPVKDPARERNGHPRWRAAGHTGDGKVAAD
jgi:hypothetical protein